MRVAARKKAEPCVRVVRVTQGALMLRRMGKQEFVASVLGITRSHVSLLVSGRTRPSLELALLIQDRLKIPARWWIASAASCEVVASVAAGEHRG